VTGSHYQIIIEIMGWIANDSPANAAAMIDRILARIRGLSSLPKMCEYARENGMFPEELRQLVVGPYRVIFTLQGREVHVLRIRHGARRPPSPDEL
jgi:plasmid stabilization system protein ParE